MQNHNNLQLTDDQYLSLSKARDLSELFVHLSEGSTDHALEFPVDKLSSAFDAIHELLDKGLSMPE